MPADKINEFVAVPLGRRPVLPKFLEEELANYCVLVDQRYFGLRRRDIRSLAYQLAIRNGLKHPFSSEKTSAGKKWLRCFLRRHPMLSFRKPQSITVARAQAFTRENVNRFFDILKPELEKIEYRPNRVFNVDETGVTVVQHTPEKVRSFMTRRRARKSWVKYLTLCHFSCRS